MLVTYLNYLLYSMQRNLRFTKSMMGFNTHTYLKDNAVTHNDVFLTLLLQHATSRSTMLYHLGNENLGFILLPSTSTDQVDVD